MADHLADRNAVKRFAALNMNPAVKTNQHICPRVPAQHAAPLSTQNGWRGRFD